jgi:hypothetical protein
VRAPGSSTVGGGALPETRRDAVRGAEAGAGVVSMAKSPGHRSTRAMTFDG